MKAAERDKLLRNALADIKTAIGCRICGYNKHGSTLAFHHVGAKKFKITAKFLADRDNQDALPELLRCTLLCHNCHSEVHNEELDCDESFTPVAAKAIIRSMIVAKTASLRDE